MAFFLCCGCWEICYNVMGMFDVFLSHRKEDGTIVDEIGRLLEGKYSLSVWFDEWNISAGDSFQDAMAKGLEESKACAVFIGEHTTQGWFKEEVEAALSRRAKDPSFRVIPVLLPNVKPDNVSVFLESKSRIDFRKGIAYGNEMYKLSCGIQGNPPGKSSVKVKKSKAHNKLAGLKEFKTLGLINDEIYNEAQRKIIDRWIDR
ncbi:Toll-Interleukin receptor domain protein [Candidatus Magnetobacterium bavaricum]|uniref:Toll-Interleukin receptor domain protein n=1 Tax=Candidatus Magnetobacterium bavaricum TaxID=29290 RepID=A0A0F3H062_9BACT|nr:Toll-Interleukin receptor domain protein [Candidatus Magnetobacterium bavaricum]